MTDTHGFQTAAEVTATFLNRVMVGAWQSGGSKPGDPPKAGTIPHSFDLDPNSQLGPVTLKSGHVRIREESGKPKLNVALTPSDSVTLTAEVEGDGEIANPQVPSLASMAFRATLTLTSRIDVDPQTHSVQLRLDEVQQNQVTVALAAGSDIVHKYGAEFIADMARAARPSLGTPKRTNVVLVLQGVNAYRGDETLQFVDNPNDPKRRISAAVSPGVPHEFATLRVPVTFNLYKAGGELEKLDPNAPTLVGVAVFATLVIKAPFREQPAGSGKWLVDLGASSKTITVEGLGPGPAPERYAANKAALGAEFELLLTQELLAFAAQLAAFGAGVTLPSKADLEKLIAEELWTKITQQSKVMIWKPELPSTDPALDAVLKIDDAAVRVLTNALLIAVNPAPGADLSAIGDFVSPRAVAVALSSAVIKRLFDAAVASKLGPLPATIKDEDDDEYIIKSISHSLGNGVVHFSGSMTVVDAIVGVIDVDADFSVDIGLEWKTDPPASVERPVLTAIVHEPDVDTHGSVLGWIVSALLGLFTGGALGAAIGLIVHEIVVRIAENTGAELFSDPQFLSVAAWPVSLPPINEVKSHFENPVDIKPDGITFSGQAD